MKFLLNPFRLALGLFSLLLLSACFESEKPLFPAGSAASPLPDSFKIQLDPATDPQAVGVVKKSGEQYIVYGQDGQPRYEMTFINLGTGDPNTYMVQNKGDGFEFSGYAYAFARVRSYGVYYYSPSCSNDLSSAERASLGHADIYRPGLPDWKSCDFTIITQVEDALRLVEPRTVLTEAHLHAFIN